MSFDLKNFLIENRLTKNAKLIKEQANFEELTNVSFPNGLSFKIGDDDPYDDGRVSHIEKKGNNTFVIYTTNRGEGYGRYYDAQGNEITEDEYEDQNTLRENKLTKVLKTSLLMEEEKNLYGIIASWYYRHHPAAEQLNNIEFDLAVKAIENEYLAVKDRYESLQQYLNALWKTDDWY